MGNHLEEVKPIRLYAALILLLGAVAIRCHDQGQTQHYKYIAQAEWSPVSPNTILITKDEYDIVTSSGSGCSSGVEESIPPPISYDLFLADSAGGVRKHLTHGSQLPALMKFKWSPTGDRIAVYGNSSFVLFIVDTNGVSRSTDSLGYAREVDWSPDGSRLVCSAQARGQTGSEAHLYFVNPVDGTTTLVLQDTAGTGVVAWSSQNVLAFSYLSSGNFVLARMNIDGSNRRDVDNAAYFSVVGWSPNGQTLLYAKLDANASDALALSIGTGTKQTILHYTDSTLIVSLKYSPDGTHISSYTFLPPSQVYLYVLSADGTTAQEIATLSSDASWSTDSKQVTYVYNNAVRKKRVQ